MIRQTLYGCLLCAITLSTSVVAEQHQATSDTGIQLPTGREQWLNYPPLSLARLDGKGLVFIYFDERSEKFAEKWPKLLDISRQHQLDPVVFVAVNSGNSPATVAQYVQRHGVTWPVIVDTDRSFEHATLRMRVDLPDDVQVRILTTDRQWMPRSERYVDKAAVAAAKEGKWLVDPNSVPLALRPAWGLIELGHYPAALPLITRATRRGDEDVQLAAEVLQATVAVRMNKELATIGEHLDAEHQWQAYQALGQLLAGFEGYDIPVEMRDKYDELTKSDAVRDQQSAAKRLEQALRAGSANTPAAITRATNLLEKLLADFPDTEAAARAQQLLDRVASPAVPPGT